MSTTQLQTLMDDDNYREYLSSVWEVPVQEAPEFMQDIPDALKAPKAPELSAPAFLDADWDDDVPVAVPSLIPIEGSNALLYTGESHYVYGRGGSGKSWVAYFAAAGVAAMNGTVLLLDYESNRNTVKMRLKLMGVCKEQAARIAYWRVAGTLRPDTPSGDQFAAWVLQFKPALVVLDSVSRALSYMGLEEDKNSDYAIFDQLVVQPLTAKRITTLMIDHIGHDNDRGGTPQPRGASTKRDHITGAMYYFRTQKGWSQTESGWAKLVCVKDREGARTEGDVVAHMIVTVTPGVSVDVSLIAPELDEHASEKSQGDRAVRKQMEKASVFMEVKGGAWSVTSLRAGVSDGGAGLSSKAVRPALDRLLAGGFIACKANKYEHVKPFRAAYTEEPPPEF